MKLCSRCSFNSPNKATICLTCGGIKFGNKSGADQANSACSNVVRKPEDAERLEIADSSNIEEISAPSSRSSFQEDLSQLWPKISSAYNKLMALAIPSSNAAKKLEAQLKEQERAYEDFLTHQEESRKCSLPVPLRNILRQSQPSIDLADEVAPIAVLSLAPPPVPALTHTAFSSKQECQTNEPAQYLNCEKPKWMTVDEIRSDLVETKEWFQNYGRNGILKQFSSSTDNSKKQNTQNISQNAA